MNQGCIEQFGGPMDVYLHPATPFVAGFLGAINWFGKAGVRPESTRVSREIPEGVPWRRAAVESTLFLGNCVHLNALLESGDRVIAEVPRDQHSFQEGESVCIHWRPADELHFE